MDDDDRTPYHATVKLPPGAVPQHSTFVVAYFTPEGETRYVVQFMGSSTLAAIIGLLELAKMEAVTSSQEWD